MKEMQYFPQKKKVVEKKKMSFSEVKLCLSLTTQTVLS